MSRNIKFAVFVILILIPLILSSQLANIRRTSIPHKKLPVSLQGPEAKDSNAVCSLCIQLMEQTLNQLINIILNVGVIGSCSKLCSYLASYGQLAVVACDLICSYVGVEEFIKILKKADLDVIFICQEVRACPIHDCQLNPCAAFGPASVEPQSQRKERENEVYFATTFDVYDQTGTGELFFLVETSHGSFPPALEGGELVADGFQKGSYNLQYNIKLQDDPEADPFPVLFRPGTYGIYNYVCQGTCGSDHSHAKLLAAQKNVTFVLTN